MKQTVIRWISTGLLLVCALLLMAGCANGKNTTQKKLVIGCYNQRPYNYLDADGEPAGLEVELAREICRRMEYQPVFQQIEWDQREKLLKGGEVDCLWNCEARDGQKLKGTWIGPYMYRHQVVAVLKDSPIQTLEDLKGKAIAVRSATASETGFFETSGKKLPDVQDIFCMEELDEVVTALRNKYVDACVGYAAALREQMDSAGVEYRFLDQDLGRTEMGVSFGEDSDERTRQKFSEALTAMKEDGTLTRILEKYGVDGTEVLGEDQP